MLNNEMKNLMYRFLKEHSKIVLPHAQSIQKVLKKLPKKFDAAKVFLSAVKPQETPIEANKNVYFNVVKLIHCDNEFTIQSQTNTSINGVTKALAQSVGFDLRDLNVTKLDEKMKIAVENFQSCNATGEGSTIEISTKDIIMKSTINVLGENIEMVIIFDECYFQ